MIVVKYIPGKEGTTMPYRWPDDTVFTRLELHLEDRWCHTCGCQLTVCDHRHRRLFTLNGPVHAVWKLAHCPQRGCPAHTRTPQSGSRNGPGHALVGAGLGRGVLAGPPAFRPPRVGWTASRGIG